MKVSIVNASNARLLRAAMRTFPRADRTILTEWGPPDHALAFVREAVRQGTEGCVRDYRIFGDPWGFSLEEITAPVQIWEGSDRPDWSSGYRAFLQRHIARATVTVVPGEGHLSLLPHQAPAILAALLGGDHSAESTARWNWARRRSSTAWCPGRPDVEPARRSSRTLLHAGPSPTTTFSTLQGLQPAPVGHLERGPRSACPRRVGSRSGRPTGGCGDCRCRGRASCPGT